MVDLFPTNVTNSVNYLVRNRRKRVVSTKEESVETIMKLSEEFSGRDLIIALSAEGFGTPFEVRVAANKLSRS